MVKTRGFFILLLLFGLSLKGFAQRKETEILQKLNPEIVKLLADLAAKGKRISALQDKKRKTNEDLNRERTLKASNAKILKNLSTFPFKDLYSLQQSLRPLVSIHSSRIESLMLDREDLELSKKRESVASAKERKANAKLIASQELILREQEYQVLAELTVLHRLKGELPAMLRVAAKRPEVPSVRAVRQSGQAKENHGVGEYPNYKSKRNSPSHRREKPSKLI